MDTLRQTTFCSHEGQAGSLSSDALLFGTLSLFTLLLTVLSCLVTQIEKSIFLLLRKVFINSLLKLLS